MSGEVQIEMPDELAEVRRGRRRAVDRADAALRGALAARTLRAKREMLALAAERLERARLLGAVASALRSRRPSGN